MSWAAASVICTLAVCVTFIIAMIIIARSGKEKRDPVNHSGHGPFS